ncbi:hypothetical protein [Candidatus Uabimicrobium sp. HlEnr_7]|uniref:hypothetical protein n=1 Tax=Candidatus Uabimicrobium helgolandensis TaxID=3095367 RepID=UPI003555FD57
MFESSPVKISKKLGEFLPAVYVYAQQKGCQPGRPFALYHGHNEEKGTFDMETGIEITEEVDSKNNI